MPRLPINQRLPLPPSYDWLDVRVLLTGPDRATGRTAALLSITLTKQRIFLGGPFAFQLADPDVDLETHPPTCINPNEPFMSVGIGGGPHDGMWVDPPMTAKPTRLLVWILVPKVRGDDSLLQIADSQESSTLIIDIEEIRLSEGLEYKSSH